MQFKKILFITSFVLADLTSAQVAQQIGSTTVYIDTLTTDVNVPWEIKVEGDNYLWVTERGGLVSRIDLNTGVKSVVLDLTTSVRAMGKAVYSD